jgi:cytochrome P450 / NADPH-cytochrome P450 reductase
MVKAEHFKDKCCNALSSRRHLPAARVVGYIQRMDMKTSAPTHRPVPGPVGLPLIGNLLQLPRDQLTQHFMQLARQYGGIFSVNFAGYRLPFVCSAQLAEVVCNEKQFRKLVSPPLTTLRPLAGDGLFTANGDEPNWALAHRILIPAFSQRARRLYFDAMLEVANALVTKWRRQPGQWLDVSTDMTRLTLDTIALCGFGERLDSFASDTLHPFVDAMVRVLDEAMARTTRPRWLTKLNQPAVRRFKADIAFLHGMVDDVIAARRATPVPTKDLLGLMLEGADPTSGERLSDTNMRFQVITFLIAGHETTSGLLSFALYFLAQHPVASARASAEVDAVWPPGTSPTYDDLDRLVVVEQVLEETLRLWPTAPAFSVAPYEDTTLPGGYFVAKDHRITVLLPALHRDPLVWAQPEVFDIDRFSPERRGSILPHAYKPFGNGSRACIGRQFAMMEAKLALAMVLQNFQLEADPGYTLQVKETLTLKPEGFRLKVRAR